MSDGQRTTIAVPECKLKISRLADRDSAELHRAIKDIQGRVASWSVTRIDMATANDLDTKTTNWIYGREGKLDMGTPPRGSIYLKNEAIVGGKFLPVKSMTPGEIDEPLHTPYDPDNPLTRHCRGLNGPTS